VSTDNKDDLTTKSLAKRVELLDHIDKLFALREKQRVLLQQLRDLTVMAGLPETERNSLCAERRVGRPMGFTLKMKKHEKKLRRDALEEDEWRPESSVEAALNPAVLDGIEKEREATPPMICDAVDKERAERTAELKKLRAFVGEIVNTAIPADAEYGVGKLKTIRVQACMLNGTDPQRAYNQDENPYNIQPPIKKLTVDSGSYYAMQRLVCDVATSTIPEMVDYRGRACAVLGINNTFDEDGTPNGSEKTDEEDTDECQTGSTPPEPASP